MANCRPAAIHIVLLKITFLIVVLIFLFIYYIEELNLDEASNPEEEYKSIERARKSFAGYCPYRPGPHKIVIPDPDIIRELLKEPPFDMGYADILINEVNNVDVGMEQKIDDLFTKIGHREDFMKVKAAKKKFPPGYSMSPDDPPPFNVGYGETLINNVYNMNPEMDINVHILIRPEPKVDEEAELPAGGQPKYYTGHMDLTHPPPFDMGQNDLLINEVNNKRETSEVNLKDFL